VIGGFGLFLGIAAAISPWLTVALVASAVGLLIVSKFKAHYILWLIAFTIPFRFEYELADARLNLTELLALLLVALVLSRSFVKREFSWVTLPYKGILSVYLVCVLVAHAYGPEIEGIAQGIWHLYKNAIALPLLYFVVFASIKSRRQVKIAAGVLIVATALSSIVGSVQTFSGGRYLTGHGANGNLRYLGILSRYPSEDIFLYSLLARGPSYVPGTDIFRAHGGLTNHINFGAFLSTVLLLTLSLFLYSRSLKNQVLLGVSIILMVGCLLFTFSRAAWVASAASSLLMISLMRKTKTFLFVVMIGLTFLMLVLILLPIVTEILPPFFLGRTTSILTPGQTPEMQGRFAAWRQALRWIEGRPLLGMGTHKVKGTIMGHTVPSSHNIFLDVAYTQGLIALGSLLLLLYMFAKDALCLHNRSDSRYFQGLGLGILGGLAAFVIAGMFSSLLAYLDTAGLFWFVAGLLVAARRVSLGRREVGPHRNLDRFGTGMR